MATSTRAERSFALGLGSLLLMFVTGIPAIILGLLGLRDIRRNPSRLTGFKLAWAGIGLGLVGTSMSAALTLFAYNRVQDALAKAE